MSMNLFSKMVNALFRDRHSVTFSVTVPAQMYMAVETLVYLRNEGTEGKGTVDRDFVVGMALSQYLTHHLTKTEEKVAAIPAAPPRSDQFTNGRRQARTPTYQSYQDLQH